MRAFLDKHKERLDAREWAVLQSELNSGRSVSWVSQEAEPALFTWYSMGRSTREISEITSVPEAMVLLTMLRYDWSSRMEVLKSSGGTPLNSMAHDAASQVFALTKMAIQRDIQEVMTGKKDPRSSKFVPQNANQLMALLDVLRDDPPPPPAPTPAHISSNVQNNTQININVAKLEAPKKPLSVSEQLRIMAGEKIEETNEDKELQPCSQ